MRVALGGRQRTGELERAVAIGSGAVRNAVVSIGSNYCSPRGLQSPHGL